MAYREAKDVHLNLRVLILTHPRIFWDREDERAGAAHVIYQ